MQDDAFVRRENSAADHPGRVPIQRAYAQHVVVAQNLSAQTLLVPNLAAVDGSVNHVEVRGNPSGLAIHGTDAVVVGETRPHLDLPRLASIGRLSRVSIDSHHPGCAGIYGGDINERIHSQCRRCSLTFPGQSPIGGVKHHSIAIVGAADDPGDLGPNHRHFVEIGRSSALLPRPSPPAVLGPQDGPLRADDPCDFPVRGAHAENGDVRNHSRLTFAAPSLASVVRSQDESVAAVAVADDPNGFGINRLHIVEPHVGDFVRRTLALPLVTAVGRVQDDSVPVRRKGPDHPAHGVRGTARTFRSDGVHKPVRDIACPERTDDALAVRAERVGRIGPGEVEGSPGHAGPVEPEAVFAGRPGPETANHQITGDAPATCLGGSRRVEVQPRRAVVQIPVKQIVGHVVTGEGAARNAVHEGLLGLRLVHGSPVLPVVGETLIGPPVEIVPDDRVSLDAKSMGGDRAGTIERRPGFPVIDEAVPELRQRIGGVVADDLPPRNPERLGADGTRIVEIGPGRSVKDEAVRLRGRGVVLADDRVAGHAAGHRRHGVRVIEDAPIAGRGTQDGRDGGGVGGLRPGVARGVEQVVLDGHRTGAHGGQGEAVTRVVGEKRGCARIVVDLHEVIDRLRRRAQGRAAVA